jgi:SAM-dependent methyltransferase
VLDLAQPLTLPMVIDSRYGGQIELAAASIETLYANNVLEHVPNLTLLMSNALALLKDGGRFEIEVPYERALTAWQDPTHVRALNENSWIYYTDWFWYLGWFEHRFKMSSSTYLDLKLQPCAKEDAAFMRVALEKVETTARERNTARTMQADLRLPDDEFAPAPQRKPAAPIFTTPTAAPVAAMASILPRAAASGTAPLPAAARPAASAPGGLDVATLDLLATTRSEALRRAAQAAVAG